MFRLQCLLTFAALYVGFARSWDIAVTTIDKLEFYDNGTKTYSQDPRFKYLSALTYDAVHNMLLFADKNNDNASIFSFYIPTKKYQALVKKSPNENIHGLAFDPVTRLLFWTDTNRKSIYYNSLSQDSRKEAYGTIMFQMKDEIPRGIAVDSCRGYIYWTNTNITKPTIERARLDGSEKEVIVSTDIHMPIDIAVDQQTKRIYWIDDKEGIRYTIESADWDGKHRTILFEGTDDHRSNALTVSKDSIYWLDSNTKTIWKLPKHVSQHSVPVEYAVCSNESPFAIVANYPIIKEKIKDQTCEALQNLSGNISAIQSLNISSDDGHFCLHGKIVDDKPLCNCTPGYTGERCEISRCQNYCFEGNCSFTTDGQPMCSCNDGYAGIRCETNICENQCLNNGTCTLNRNNEPTCLCIGDYEGARCETLKIVTMAMDNPPFTNESLSSVCNCTSTQNETKLLYHVSSETQSPSSVRPPPETTSPIIEELMASCTPDWDSVRDPAIMALGILSGLLCLLCVVLITKILQLKKRPRIKKRIIVNKNVTPLTARPDQCEITIENCCNMNICETPCFEPRSTIRPKLLDSKDGKDEKKNLIANMEYPDDPY